MIVFSSKATVSGRAGLVPVAITMSLAVTWRRRLAPSSISTVFGPVNRPVPARIATPFLVSWLRTTWLSRPTTCCVLAVRSAIVISSLTW
jgi:hypothetical protein